MNLKVITFKTTKLKIYYFKSVFTYAYRNAWFMG